MPLRISTYTKMLIAQRIAVDPYAVAVVTLDGVDNTILDLLDDSHMVCKAVLRPGRTTGVIPIKEDNHAGEGFSGVVHPLPSVPEPLDAQDTACELRDNTVVNITALVGAP